MSTGRRFLLYVKAASNGRDIGDCPFSQRVLMFAKLKVLDEQINIEPVDIANKPVEFGGLNTDGKVPVLVDRRKEKKIIADSAEITKYLNDEFPDCDCKCGYTGPALDACSGIFPKLATLLKNKDQTKVESLKTDLLNELAKLNKYLENDTENGKYLIGDDIAEIDCMLLPRLRHVKVAGGHFAGLEIPDEMTDLHRYIEEANKNDIYRATCCPDEEIVKGWARHVK